MRDVDASGVTTENWREFLSESVAKWGEWHSVIPMHPEDHEVKDPIEELIDTASHARIWVCDENGIRPE